MIRAFVEISTFTKKAECRGGHDLILQIQTELLERPDSGALIPGIGGLRKLRVADSQRGKGKRGGHRVIYLDIPKAGLTFLIALYDKNEKDDISSDEKRIMRGLADILKREANANAKN